MPPMGLAAVVRLKAVPSSGSPTRRHAAPALFPRGDGTAVDMPTALASSVSQPSESPSIPSAPIALATTYPGVAVSQGDWTGLIGPLVIMAVIVGIFGLAWIFSYVMLYLRRRRAPIAPDTNTTTDMPLTIKRTVLAQSAIDALPIRPYIPPRRTRSARDAVAQSWANPAHTAGDGNGGAKADGGDRDNVNVDIDGDGAVDAEAEPAERDLSLSLDLQATLSTPPDPHPHARPTSFPPLTPRIRYAPPPTAPRPADRRSRVLANLGRDSLLRRLSRRLSRHLRATAEGRQSDECVVCLEELDAGEGVRVLPCGHEYHPECIDPWLRDVTALCPLCKFNLATGMPFSESTAASEPSTSAAPVDADGAATQPLTSATDASPTRGGRRNARRDSYDSDDDNRPDLNNMWLGEAMLWW